MKRRAKLVTLACVLLMAACFTPATTRNEGAPEAGPRFASRGPDAKDYGASLGYPNGERGTFLRVPSLVGSHSHLDELFEGRVVGKAATRPQRGSQVFDRTLVVGRAPLREWRMLVFVDLGQADKRQSRGLMLPALHDPELRVVGSLRGESSPH
jgi:hypothetical protein